MSTKYENILLTRRLQDSALKDLERKFHVDIHSGKFPIPKKTLIKKIGDKTGIICMPYDIIDKEVIDSAKDLKVISTYSVGYEHIDIEYAKEKKIRVGFTPDVLTEATADLAFTLMLDLLRRVTEGDRLIRGGRWKQVLGPDSNLGIDIEGKTVGILGLGRIGKSFAKRAKAFGMNICYHNRNRLNRTDEKDMSVKYVTLDELFSKSDVITIHVPYTKQTHEMINSKLLKKMKKESFLVNTARGKIINESDLVKSLKRKEIAGAALDVFYTEPLQNNSPLIKLDNVVLVPHIGSATKETRAEMAKIAIQNLELGIKNKKPKYSVGY
jgi:glyoxylate reductase